MRTGRVNRGRRLLVLATETGVAVVIRTRDNADWLLSRSHQTKHRNGIGRRNTTLQCRALATDVAGSADVIVCRAAISAQRTPALIRKLPQITGFSPNSSRSWTSAVGVVRGYNRTVRVWYTQRWCGGTRISGFVPPCSKPGLQRRSGKYLNRLVTCKRIFELSRVFSAFVTIRKRKCR